MMPISSKSYPLRRATSKTSNDADNEAEEAEETVEEYRNRIFDTEIEREIFLREEFDLYIGSGRHKTIDELLDAFDKAFNDKDAREFFGS